MCFKVAQGKKSKDWSFELEERRNFWKSDDDDVRRE